MSSSVSQASGAGVACDRLLQAVSTAGLAWFVEACYICCGFGQLQLQLWLDG